MGGVPPSPTWSRNDATPRARTPSPSGRHPPPPVPPGGRPPLRRRPLRRRPRGGPPRDQGGLERPDLHPAGDPLGLPRPGAQRRPVLPRRGGPPDRPPRRAGARAVQLRDGGLLPGAGSACPSGSSPPWPASSGGTSTRGSIGDGSGRAAASASSTARRSPCPTPRRTAASTRWPTTRSPGTSFAPARIGAIISLSCGAILDLGVCRYAGKGQGEVSLLRQLWDVLRPGDVLLGDRLMSGWVGMYLLKQRGVDTVSRLSAHRRADFRKGTRLGKDDHLVVWKKPTSIRSVDRETYNALPDSITVREVRFRVEQPGFRTRSVVVVTTILDPGQASAEELASLYRARWNNEVCQADCTSRFSLCPSGGSPHSGRGGAARTGPVGPPPPARNPGAIAMQRDNDRSVPPACRQPGTPGPPEPALGRTAGPGPSRRARRAQPDGGPAAADASSEAGGAA